MTVLALEPDPRHAATIRHVVYHLARADLTLVHSTDDALEALRTDLPDLVLLPPLFSPADEGKLLAYLRTLPNGAHVETLMTPFWCAPDEPATVSPRGWRRWRTAARSRPRSGGSDLRVFAEQLTSSLSRAHEARHRNAERYQSQSEIGESLMIVPGNGSVEPLATVVLDPSTGQDDLQCPAEEPDPQRHVTAVVPALSPDRRAYPRFAASELQGLRAARITRGPYVSLLDLSAGGALLETVVPLEPESEALLELLGDTRDTVVPFRVLRCQVSTLEGRSFYRGACSFSRPLALADLLCPRVGDGTPLVPDHLGRFDIALKELVDQYVLRADRQVDLLHSPGASQVREIVSSLREVSRLRRSDPVAPAINDLLAVVISALQHGGKSSVDFTLIEEQLHAALPWATTRFAAAPTPILMADAEGLYFQIPGPGGQAPCVLNVELPQGSTLEDWEFRLLKATTWLAALLGVIPDADALPRAPDDPTGTSA